MADIISPKQTRTSRGSQCSRIHTHYQVLVGAYSYGEGVGEAELRVDAGRRAAGQQTHSGVVPGTEHRSRYHGDKAHSRAFQQVQGEDMSVFLQTAASTCVLLMLAIDACVHGAAVLVHERVLPLTARRPRRSAAAPRG